MMLVSEILREKLGNSLVNILALVLSTSSAFCETERLLTFDEFVIRSTVKLQSGPCIGSGFILLNPVPTLTNFNCFVLVTAAHVLSSMPSTNVSLFMRSAEKGVYKRLTNNIPIRLNGTNLWVQHPTADVAVMRIPLPMEYDLGMLETGYLAEDNFFEKFHYHPGDEVRIMGFPHGFEANNVGFPVLRSGRIASYPLSPTSEYPTFMIDFRVFPGNSGGPVYVSERRHMIKDSLEAISITAIVGLVSQEAKVSETITSQYEHSIRTYQLGLGIVVPARFIIETIKLLPPFSPRSAHYEEQNIN